MSKVTKKYRKKPVVIEAYQTCCKISIETLEGTMTASPGDWIITGVNGERYPCKQDIFEKTYELVED
jgi:thioredoxin-like negative regulator of GroEL